MNKRLYVGMITLMVGGIATWGSTQTPKKVGMVNFTDSKTNKARVCLIDGACMSSRMPWLSPITTPFDTAALSVWNQDCFFPSYVGNFTTHTRKEMDALLDPKNKEALLKEDKVKEEEYAAAYKAWQEGNVYFLDNENKLAHKNKDNHFNDQAKPQPKDRNTLRDTQDDTNTNPTSNNILGIPKDKLGYGLLAVVILAFIGWVISQQKSVPNSQSEAKP